MHQLTSEYKTKYAILIQKQDKAHTLHYRRTAKPWVKSQDARKLCQASVCASVFVSSQQRFGVMDIKAPSACHSSRVLDRPCYSSKTNQCYSSILFRRQQENPSSKKRREWRSAPARRGGGWGAGQG